MDKNLAFMNIIKNSEIDPKQKKELYNLHQKQQSLLANSNMYKQIEYNMNKLKIEKLSQEIDEYKFQKKFYIQRNNNLLNDIENNKFKSSQLSLNSKSSFDNLINERNKYQNYLNDISPKIKNEFHKNLILENNVFSEVKKKEIEKLNENENKNNFYDELGMINENEAKQIEKLRERNEEVSRINKEKKIKFLEREKYLKKLLNIPDEEEERRRKIEEERKRKFEEEERKRKEEEEERKRKEEEEISRKEEIKRKDEEREQKKLQEILNRQKKLREVKPIIKPKNNDLNNTIKEDNKININNDSENEEIQKIDKNEEEKEEEEKKEQKEKNEEINNVIEDMCAFGIITKKQIQEEKEKNPEKFIKIEDALKKEEEDNALFALGLLANVLEDSGVETAIESSINEEQKEDENDIGTTSLQFLSNGMGNKTRYDLHFDFGEEKNEEILNDEEEFEKFKEQLKLKLSKDYNVPPEKIIVTFPQKGSLRVQVIFQSNEFNNLDKKEFIEKFKNDDEFEELKNIKEVHSDLVLNALKLTKGQLAPEGNRVEGWGINEKRGNRPYYPPLGWIGIGLKVLDKYDNGDNTWIGMDNSPGEWCVAYHGVGRDTNPETVHKITKSIINTKFKAGINNWHASCDDLFHEGKKVGDGVYCTPKIEVAEGYSGESKSNGKFYKTVLMVRVKNEAIRHCDCWDAKDYWVVNGTLDEIRPYRILYKEISH